MGMGCLGAVCVDLCVEWLLGIRGLRVHKVNS